ncbi:hydroxyisourate hydrolase [Paracoccus sp. Z118]|uniref:hydroxyisourate hydrolase n=1 Tax=Paracoccus sp. Z118 TaxID=2851017 RepID=UPI001C2BB621|nr:hydroxyisourate hydrolase [Paracoccus sp. Z118]MBV0891078.1 hydroxyisourate hydrolase [Paracoccus sp. Z118]
MAGYLTTHVLDTANGRPAAGMRITLHALDGARRALAEVTTNDDGRTDGPILPQDRFAAGRYELVFHVGEWLDAQGAQGGQPRFLDEVPIRFGMGEDDHYHVPLLISPYGYSTYRGS